MVWYIVVLCWKHGKPSLWWYMILAWTISDYDEICWKHKKCQFYAEILLALKKKQSADSDECYLCEECQFIRRYYKHGNVILWWGFKHGKCLFVMGWYVIAWVMSLCWDILAWIISVYYEFIISMYMHQKLLQAFLIAFIRKNAKWPEIFVEQIFF